MNIPENSPYKHNTYFGINTIDWRSIACYDYNNNEYGKSVIREWFNERDKD